MQHRRISSGVSSGLLIKSEARELRREHRMIRARFKIAGSDGVLTHIERRNLKNIRPLKSSAVFRSWLYRIAINRIRDFYRKKKFKSLFGFVFIDQESFQETNGKIRSGRLKI
jgi:hypothetical protein